MAERWVFDAVTGRSGQLLAEEKTSLRRGALPRPVRRAVEADVRTLDLVGLLGQIPAGEATLTLRGPVARRHEQADLRTYRASLRFGGVVPVRQEVEIDVATFGARVGSLTIRSAERLPRRIEPTRYEAAVAAALASIERLLPWQAANNAMVKAAEARVLQAANAVLADAEETSEDEQAA
ncbi:MAG: hypothetical protein M0004_16875 [Actinomycetota bacterium]|nr:hypothetical protein [Actinomycetota bacterium]